MKYSEITFVLILRAIQKQWKLLLGCVVSFTAIGILSGFIWADDLAASPKGGVVDGLILPDFSSVDRDANYYINCSNQLSAAATRAENCLLLVKDSALNAEQKAQLTEMEERLALLRESVLLPLWDAVYSGAYLPEICIAEGISLYETRLQTAEAALLSSRQAHALLTQQGIAIPHPTEFSIDDFTDERSPYGERKLLEMAAYYDSLVQAVDSYRKILTQLREQPEEVIAQTRVLDAELNEAGEQLYSLVFELQNTVTEIAEQQNLDLFIFYDEMEDGYYINLENPVIETETKEESGYDATEIYDRCIAIHNHGYRSEQDAFLILTLFCVLVGVCAGGFFSVCRQTVAEQRAETYKEQE